MVLNGVQIKRIIYIKYSGKVLLLQSSISNSFSSVAVHCDIASFTKAKLKPNVANSFQSWSELGD